MLIRKIVVNKGSKPDKIVKPKFTHKDKLPVVKDLHIKVHIPYLFDGDLGAAYNEIMQAHSEWVLFLDQDLFLCNPNWYYICCSVIAATAENNVGLYTCWTNRIGCPLQKHPKAPQGDDIGQHVVFANKLWKENGCRYTDITNLGRDISGFCMLTHKKVWERVGGFKDGFLTVDNDYHGKLRKNGYRVYRMDGLYFYHRYKRDWVWD